MLPIQCIYLNAMCSLRMTVETAILLRLHCSPDCSSQSQAQLRCCGYSRVSALTELAQGGVLCQ